MKSNYKQLLKENNNREKEILKANDSLYTDMIVYLRSADMTEYNQELVRSDLIKQTILNISLVLAGILVALVFIIEKILDRYTL